MTGESWDVVVVGAGPAGSSTAARLGEAGYRVLLLDRDRFPRPKPCGECINPAGIHELEGLGALDAVLREPHAAIAGWRVVPRSGGTFDGRYPQDRHGIAVARAVFDRVLLDLARERGATVRTGVRVARLLRGRQGVEGVAVTSENGVEEIRSRLLVGADGLRSVVVRRLGLLKRPPRLRKLALTSHVRGLRDVAQCGELHIRPRGSIGLAPIGGGLFNLTVVVSGTEAARVAGDRDAYYDEVLASYPRLQGAQRVAGVLATGPFDWPTRTAVADGALLVGDAAGYFDPFTGQGIYRALRGAALAAEVAVAALSADDVSAEALEPYERARRQAFYPGTRLQRAIEPFLARPLLMRMAANRFRRRPALADSLIAVIGDLQPVRTLWAPQNLARLFA
jgi:geranylgeranyl reductase family protein